MADVEPLSPRKTAAVLVIVAGCFAVLWPRLLSPALLGRSAHDPLAPNLADRAQGCCDVIFETDVDAIKIMIELCGNILEKKRGSLDGGTVSAFATGKLSPEIIRECRVEVNATCGVDISTFLQHNVKLGKTYKQILEEVRSYNSSTCLKMHFGVPTWALGSGHVTGKMWSEHEIDNIKQERPPHQRATAPHPAMRERGRAIPDPRPARPPLPPGGATPETIKRMQGRPPPVPGVRPPMGGAGGVVPPPKSTQVGLVMPIYTLCIVVFFVYTLCKILFKRTDTTTIGGNYTQVGPDPVFRRRVFEDQRGSRASPETKLVVSAISGLVAEVQQQMEENYAQSLRAPAAQVQQSENNVPYKNGSLRSAHDASPVRIIAKEYKETVSESLSNENKTVEHKESLPDPNDLFEKLPKPTPRQPTSEPNIVKEPTPELLADAIKEEIPRKENGDVPRGNGDVSHGRAEKDNEDLDNLSEEEIEYEEDDEESPVVRQVRASVEKDKATVKVLGIETTAHCEGGAAWGDRPLSPPALPRPATPIAPPHRPHEAAEVSSIYLEGDIPLQSRLLVADSETHKEDTADEPVVLSGKMTLSLINDGDRGTPDRELESVTQDDDFTTASAYTQPKQNYQEEELSEEEIEEEVEEIAEDEAVGVEGILQNGEKFDNTEKELEAVVDTSKVDVKEPIIEVDAIKEFVDEAVKEIQNEVSPVKDFVSEEILQQVEKIDIAEKELEVIADTSKVEAKEAPIETDTVKGFADEVNAVKEFSNEVKAVKDFVNEVEGSHSVIKEINEFEKIMKEMDVAKNDINDTKGFEDVIKEIETVEDLEREADAVEDILKEAGTIEKIIKEAQLFEDIAKQTVRDDDFVKVEEITKEIGPIEDTPEDDTFEKITKEEEIADIIMKQTEGIEDIVQEHEDVDNVEEVEEVSEDLKGDGRETEEVESLKDIVKKEIDKVVLKAMETVEDITNEEEGNTTKNEGEVKNIVTEGENNVSKEIDPVQDIVKEEEIGDVDEIEELEEEEVEEIEEIEEEEVEEEDNDGNPSVNNSA